MIYRSRQNCGNSVWILLHVTLLVPRIFRCPLDFGKFVDFVYGHSTEPVTMDKILCHQTDTFVLVIHHQFDPCGKDGMTLHPTVHYSFDLIVMSRDFL